ncbi:hypothetical protein Pmi06nite_18600 [Planotetraspora mira]|uniref:DUF8094 domain-containing protein n=1 Tax=Planotetraspora mira TaxID=58121 RepID=A0A8J3TJX5_9ACTN|nr:hypothetical protein Pmi06nite_18600 [Planotetraspora mira]
MRLILATAIVVLPVVVGGCSFVDGGEPPSVSKPPVPPPSPTPALSEKAAQSVIKRYMQGINAANGKLNSSLASKVESGSAHQIHNAQYKVFKRNGLNFGPVKYTSGLAAAPKFSGYPKWFFAAATDSGSKPATRDILLFVQERAGAPWRVAYAPFSRKATGPIASGVDVADFPDVVPAGDPGLVVPPSKVAPALAEVITRGTRSAWAKQFDFGRLVKSQYQGLLNTRKAYVGNNWTGTSRAVAAKTPIYAVRTKTGGALAWFGIDVNASYRGKDNAAGMTWKSADFGDFQKGFGIPSTVRSSITSVERNEILAYIPPKGKGKVQIIANRWFPVSVKGR